MSTWLDQFESLDVIGNGSFGVIRKVRRKADGQVFARKDLDFSRMTDRDRRQIVAEVNILKDLHNPHIVRYHDRYVDRDAGVLYILMEYCGGGDLSAIIKRHARDAERAAIAAGQPTAQLRGLDEDRIWQFLLQILRALVYCHHPNASTSGSSSGSGRSSLGGAEGEAKRPQILHRDLKPDNVFLDENNNVKLGDFGLSKALQQASFANTYVGTPYYMSPEVMQEKAYDSKSDIWSLGCMVYELCALAPPFHEAKTHAELSTFIRNGRIPPLPRGYSNTLQTTIKGMLNINPAMRPSALQLLQHEPLRNAAKIEEAQSMITQVKAHKSAVLQRERDLLAREQAIAERETLHIALQEAQRQCALAQQEAERLSALLAQQQQAQAQGVPEEEVQTRIRQALHKREDEVRGVLAKLENRCQEAMAAREAELVAAVRAHEESLGKAWADREAELEALRAKDRAAYEEQTRKREDELKMAWDEREALFTREWKEREAKLKEKEDEIERMWSAREEAIEAEWEARMAEAVAEAVAESNRGGLHIDTSVEEVQNILDISSSTDTSITTDTTVDSETSVLSSPTTSTADKPILKPSLFKTPVPNGRLGANRKTRFQTPLPALGRELLTDAGDLSIVRGPPPLHIANAAPPPSPGFPLSDWQPVTEKKRQVPGSAMKGIILTSTGQPLATPSPAEFVRMFAKPSKGVALNFQSMFEEDESGEADTTARQEEGQGSVLDAAWEKTEKAPPPPRSPAKTRTLAPASPSKRALPPPSPSRLLASKPVLRAASAAPPALRRAPSVQGVKKAASSSNPPRVFTSKVETEGDVVPTRTRRQSNAPKPEQDTAVTTVSTSSASTTTSTSSGSDSTVRRAHRTAKGSEAEAAPRKITRAHTVASIPAGKTETALQADEAAPEYDLDDEENLPSPFLKRVDRERFPAAPASDRLTRTKSAAATMTNGAAVVTRSATLNGRVKSAAIGSAATGASAPAGSAAPSARRVSSGNLLRVAAANAAAGKSEKEETEKDRPAVTSSRRMSDITRQRLKA